MMPCHILKALGNSVVIKAYVDDKHTENKSNTRFSYGIIMYVNNAPIVWYSKHHNTVDSSSLGSNFVAPRIAIDTIKDFQCNIRCFGVSIDCDTEVFCDNKSGVKNYSITSSVLTKVIMPVVTIKLWKLMLQVFSILVRYWES